MPIHPYSKAKQKLPRYESSSGVASSSTQYVYWHKFEKLEENSKIPTKTKMAVTVSS